MKDVLGFDLTSLGFLASIPYIFYFICINLGGIIADILQKKKILSTLNTRRLAMLVGKHLYHVVIIQELTTDLAFTYFVYFAVFKKRFKQKIKLQKKLRNQTTDG